MFKTILTHMTGTDCDQPVLTTASQVARLFQAIWNVCALWQTRRPW